MGENGEIARRGLDAFLRRSFEEAQRLCSDDVQLWTLYDEAGQEPMFRGRDGLRAWFDRIDQLWAFTEALGIEVDERPGGWVMMQVDARVRGRGSREAFELRVAVAMLIEDRLLTRFGLFADEPSADRMIAAASR